MGQATAGIYSLLGSRCRKLRIHEWKPGGLQTFPAPSSYSGFSRCGNFLVCENPTVPELWGALYSAITQQLPMVLLPPCSPLEKEVLLRQLPGSPPKGALLVLFTSGTTGEPKAVFHSERSLLASASQLALVFPGNGPTCSLLAPWGMAGVAFHCLLPAARGGTDILFSAEPFLNWASDALRIFREHSVELITLNPFLLEMLLRSGLDSSFKGELVSLTAPLKASQREGARKALGREAHEIYGMTEAAGPVLLDGKSLGARTKLAADGELLVSGEQLFLGYAGNGIFSTREEWFATGDLFHEHSGLLVHQARTRELIDVGGRKIAPALVEAAFEKMEELTSCVAFAKEVAGTERPALAYVRAPACKLNPAELKALVMKRSAELLSAELRPALLLELESLPRTKNGKIDRLGMKQLA